jgi:hypothetical protein
VVVGLNGEIWSVNLGLGHNNDQGLYRITEMDANLRTLNIKLVADAGYQDNEYLIRPNGANGDEWNSIQSGLRYVWQVVAT